MAATNNHTAKVLVKLVGSVYKLLSLSMSGKLLSYMADNKQHHLTAASYLAAFSLPPNKKGRLWVMDSTLNIYPTSPIKALREKDFYLIRDSLGKPSLEIETKYLGGIENLFATHTQKKILALQTLDLKDKAILSLMCASMLARSPSLRRAQEKFLQDIHETVQLMNSVPVEKRTSAVFPFPNDSVVDSMSEEELEKMRSDIGGSHTQGIPYLTSALFPYIYGMKCNVLVNNSATVEFITSDNPCNMANPELIKIYGAESMLSSPGVDQPGVEVTLPISPNHAIIFGYQMNGDLNYANSPHDKTQLVLNINSRTTMHARKLVARSKEGLLSIKEKSLKQTDSSLGHQKNT